MGLVAIEYNTATAVVSVDEETSSWLNCEEGLKESCVEGRFEAHTFRFHLNSLSLQQYQEPEVSGMTPGAPSFKRLKPSPWVGTRVSIVAHPNKRGYHGTVRDVRPDSNSISGLAVKVDYDVINTFPPVEWLDYDHIRNKE